KGTGLENRRACKGTVGSNPTPSASRLFSLIRQRSECTAKSAIYNRDLYYIIRRCSLSSRLGKGRRSLRTNSESVESVPPRSSQAPALAAPATHTPKEKLGFNRANIGRSLIGMPLPEDWTPDEALCAQVATDFGMTDEDLRKRCLPFAR
ncbi:MAG: hypothetical protein JWQ07_5085, partial [Ramlibacter sp.]|nr:hypothetical protein [Ramlibacter sp.]